MPLNPKLLNGNYYLYRATKRDGRSTGNSKKVSKHNGRIRENGKVEAHHSKRSIYDYRNSQLFYSLSSHLIESLRKHFPETRESIYTLSRISFIDPVPMGSERGRLDILHINTLKGVHDQSQGSPIFRGGRNCNTIIY